MSRRQERKRSRQPGASTRAPSKKPGRFEESSSVFATTLRIVKLTLRYGLLLPIQVIAVGAFFLLLAYLSAAAPSDPAFYYLTPIPVGIALFLWFQFILELCKRQRFARLPLLVSLLGLAITLHFGLMAFIIGSGAAGPPHQGAVSNAWIYALALPVLAFSGRYFWRSALLNLRMRRFMKLLATTPPGGVAAGLCEVAGTAQPTDDRAMLKSPLQDRRCLAYWSWHRERHGDRTSWVLTESRGDSFLCTDDDGAIRVGIGAGYLYTDWHYAGAVAESVLEPGESVYVFGTAKIDEESGDRLIITRDADFALQVSTRSEAEVRSRYRSDGFSDIAWLIVHSVLIVLMVILLLRLDPTSILLFVGLIGPIVAVLFGTALYLNDLFILRNRALRNRSNLAASLRKRADLLPNLEKCISGVMYQEKAVHRRIAELRRSCPPADLKNWEAMESYLAKEAGAVEEVVALLENHPELKSNPELHTFMRELITLENEVAFIRQGYNDTVSQYHDRRERFPDRLVAPLLGLRRLPLLRVNLRVRRMPYLLRS